MLQLKQKSTTPPNGWRYQQPDGPMLEAGDFGQLVLRVLDYRNKHGLPSANLAAEVEDEICRRTGAKCAPPRPVPDGTAPQVGIAEVWRFIVTMREWMKDGTLVDQAEAERRAELCSSCRYNVELAPGSCWGCAGVAGKVLEIIGDRRTRMDHLLKNCAVCACFNTVAAWVPLPVLLKASGSLEYPADTGARDAYGKAVPCWKRVASAET